MKPNIIVFPGSNCDRDVYKAIKSVIGTSPKMIWHKETSLKNTNLIVLPGGISHGDYLRSGSIASRAPIMKEVIKKAKNEGKIFTTGVSINNLSLNENDIGDFKTFLKLSPPLRTENDRQSLVEAVNDGTIDVIVSDHKPEDEESKRLTFSQAATGATGVETLLPLALELFHNKSVKLVKLIASITSNPAKILGINKGSLEKGNEADLCVFDINKPWVVNKDKLKSKSKNTPIEGRKLQGQVLKTFVKGEMSFERV